MTHLIFFEKPGCGGNARQRALLTAAGHTLTRRNLLEAPWTREELLAYLGPLPVTQWFNRAAPRIKAGALVPEGLTVEAALAELLVDPLLIRRPLMQREDGARMVGFDLAEVERFVGLRGQVAGASNLEGCVAAPGVASCRPAGAHAD
jgi:nitrogenase-associated protein